MQFVLAGIYDLLDFIDVCIEMATFYLMSFLMMRVTRSHKLNYTALQKFLFEGFVNHEELENALIAQHPDMSQDHRDALHSDC